MPRATRALITTLAVLLLSVPVAEARGGGGGGGRSSGGGGRSSCCSSKPSGGGSKSSGTSKSGGTSRPAVATAAKPSTGPKQQRAPVAKLIPPTPPKIPALTRPATGKGGSFLNQSPGTKRTVDAFGQRGRNYGGDRDFMRRNPSYSDPYYRDRGAGATHVYYGDSTSPLLYMWAFGFFDNDHGNDPLPPETQGAEVSTATASYLSLITSELRMIGGVDAPAGAPAAGAAP